MYFTRTKSNEWNVKDAVNYYEEVGKQNSRLPMLMLFEELNGVITGENQARAKAAQDFMASFKNTMNDGPAEQINTGTGPLTINGGVGEINTVNNITNNNNDPFPCTLSPILPANEVNDDIDCLDDSFISEIHHELRATVYLYNSEETWPDCSLTWIINNQDIIAALKRFWETSAHLAKSQGNIKDIRVLALHRIFPFMLTESGSITSYLGLHDEVGQDLAAIRSSSPTISSDIALWCDSLTLSCDDFLTVKKKCCDILVKAYEKGNENDILATLVLFNLAPNLAVEYDKYMVEDTFVHVYLDSILHDVFSTDKTFRQSWANSALESSTRFKPDWLLYVRPWYTKIDITSCEVKPPSKHGAQDFPDFVKLGLEMRGMLNKMVEVVDTNDAMVFGILVEGLDVKTFAMDMKAQVYRMIQLQGCKLVSEQSCLGVFPCLFRCILQVKNLAAGVALKIKAAQMDKAAAKRKDTAGPSWVSSEVVHPTKQRRTSGSED